MKHFSDRSEGLQVVTVQRSNKNGVWGGAPGAGGQRGDGNCCNFYSFSQKITHF